MSTRRRGLTRKFIREISEIRGRIKTATLYVNDDDDDDYLRDGSVFLNTNHTDCTNLARRFARAASGVIAFSLTQTSQKTQNIRTLLDNQ